MSFSFWRCLFIFAAILTFSQNISAALLLKKSKKKDKNSAITGLEQVPGKIKEELKKAVQDLDQTVIFNVIVQDNNNSQTTSIVGADFLSLKAYTDLFEEGKHKAKNGLNLLWDYIKNNKKRLLFSSMLASYAATQIRLLYLKYKLNNSVKWSSWEKDKTMEDLYQTSHDTLASKLLKNIQNKYTTIDNPTDFVKPLINFMTDTDEERKNLESYKNTVLWLQRLCLGKLFFYDQKLINKIPEQLNRLSYIKSTFLSWLADYKVGLAK